MTRYIRIRNWDQRQHYHTRTPPWIKLHNELLDSLDWHRLPDASKAHVVGLWMLASRYDNRIPDDVAWIANRISASEPMDMQRLVEKGFIEYASDVLASDKQKACLEGEREGERETEGETEKAGADAPHDISLPDLPTPEPTLGAWYAEQIKPLLWPTPHPVASEQRKSDGRQIAILRDRLKSFSRSEVELAVGEARAQAEEGRLQNGWAIAPGDNFGLPALLAQGTGIETFRRFLHDAYKREAR